MKKVLSFTAIAALAAMVSCGPSQEEMDAKNKMMRDSIAADSTKKADEMRAQMMKDSTDQANMAAMNKMKEDSIKMADSMAKLPGKKKK